jgi:hypothetical protein
MTLSNVEPPKKPVQLGVPIARAEAASPGDHDSAALGRLKCLVDTIWISRPSARPAIRASEVGVDRSIPFSYALCLFGDVACNQHASPHRAQPGLELVVAPAEVVDEVLPEHAIGRSPQNVATFLF